MLFKIGHCDKTTSQTVFIFTILHSDAPLTFHAKIQPIPSGSGEVDLVNFAIFNNGSHPGHLTRPNFTFLRPCSQVMLHVKFENCRFSGFIEEDVQIHVIVYNF